MIGLLIPLLLIMMQGLFTATETAVLSIEKSLLGRAKHEKKKWAMRTHKLLVNPDRFFSTILICEDLLLVVASTLFARFFLIYFGKNSIIFSTILLSFFSLVVGQYIPKSIALLIPEKTLVVSSRAIYFIEIVLTPIVFLFSVIARGIAFLFRTKTRTDVIRHSDIVFAMSEYEKEASKLTSRLFNFSRRTVVEVMIPLNAVNLCRKGDELRVFSRGLGRLFTRIPVYDGNSDNIVGIFNIKDYLYTDNLVLRPPFHVNVNDRCMSLFLTMKEKGEHIAVIRDDRNKILGIVTLEDLIEELVGEIRDEK